MARSSFTTVAMEAKSSVKMPLRRNMSTSSPVHMAGDGDKGAGDKFWKKACFMVGDGALFGVGFFFGGVFVLTLVKAIIVVVEQQGKRGAR